MRDKRWTLKLMGLLMGLMLIAAACGGGDDGAEDGETGEPVRGGILRLGGIEDFDFLDPGQQYFQLTNAMLDAVVRKLTVYTSSPDPEETTRLVADLATDTGTPNDDFTEWTFTLKDGVTFGLGLGGEEIPGVTGRQITSDDVAYAFERIFTKSVGNQYAFYFDTLEGIEEFQSGKADTLSGIETPDDKTIVFNLSQPQADWPSRVQFTAAAPVPREYAKQFDSKKSSDYDRHVVASGPYYIESYTPGDLLELRKDPNWDPDTDDEREAYLDGVDWDLGFEEPNIVSQQIADGELDFTFDGTPEGPLRQRFFQDPELRELLYRGPAASTRYLYMNTRIEPFDDIQVREAVNLAIDRENIRRVYGGPTTGEIPCSVLPPGIAGHLPCDEYNPFETPNMGGDMEQAQQLMADAGFPDGFDGEIFLVGATDTPHDRIAEVVRSNLEELGFSNINPRLVAFPNQYTQFYSVRAKDVAFGTASGWVWDWPDAMTFFDPLFNGANISETANNNYSELDDPEINQAIENAINNLTPGTEEYTAAMEEINRLTTESAVWVPWLWDTETTVHSARVRGIEFNQNNGTSTFINMWLEGGGSA